jgi:hypothetical protein
LSGKVREQRALGYVIRKIEVKQQHGQDCDSAEKIDSIITSAIHR